VIIALGIVVLLVISPWSGGGTAPLPRPAAAPPAGAADPFVYDRSRMAEFTQRATAGEAYVLFAKSPGGVIATAARVAAYRSLIDKASTGSGVDPQLLQAIVFLESSGLPDAIAGSDPANAAGLTQILAGTGTSLLGMRIDLSASRRLTRRIVIAELHGQDSLAARLRTARARIDDRFNPRLALAATVRYLQIAERRFGRQDLAAASYHMGIGNLTEVLDRYDGGRPVPYPQLFFDISPDHHPAAYSLLSGFGDDSWLYYWRLLGSEQIMSLYRTDRPALVRLTALETAGDSDAEVLQPPDRTTSFADPGALAAAYASHKIVPLPSNAGELGLSYAGAIGAYAGAIGARRALYRGLRGDALALLIELAARVRALSGVRAALIVASAVTDRRYQQQLGASYPQGTTGYSFQIARRYAAPAQAAAFQSMLDRLQALNLIGWAAEPGVIDITVASGAARYIAGH
jgi:hypothetical protein